MKQAFTLAEMIIVFMVIGFLSLITIRSLGDLQPDREKVMFKKAYSVAERAIGELVNDETIYPYDPEKIGFRNTSKACLEGTTTCYKGIYKFCGFFASKLNIIGDIQNNGSKCAFKTADGMYWYTNVMFGETTQKLVFIVDVDGNEKGVQYPDYTGIQVRSNKALLTTDDIKKAKRDRFYIDIYYDGKVSVVPNSLEEEYLSSHEARRR